MLKKRGWKAVYNTNQELTKFNEKMSMSEQPWKNLQSQLVLKKKFEDFFEIYFGRNLKKKIANFFGKPLWKQDW